MRLLGSKFTSASGQAVFYHAHSLLFLLFPGESKNVSVIWMIHVRRNSHCVQSAGMMHLIGISLFHISVVNRLLVFYRYRTFMSHWCFLGWLRNRFESACCCFFKIFFHQNVLKLFDTTYSSIYLNT